MNMAMKYILGYCVVLICVNTISAKYGTVGRIFNTKDSEDLAVEGKYKDCQERWNSGEREPGLYPIYTNKTHKVEVYCDHSELATYTVIHRRIDGSVSFARDLIDYQLGFGNPQGDYWAGLDTIHHLTTTGNTKLVIDMSTWTGNHQRVTYSHFLVLDHTQYYRMYIGGYQGAVGDSMSYSNGMYFYTLDYPDSNNCTRHLQCGWWFNNCALTSPNGKYYNGGKYHPGKYYDGIFWKTWMDYDYSMKFFSMSVYQ